MLEEIKQRDAAFDWPYIERREDAYGVARGTLTSDAVRDRRWLLARVEELRGLLRQHGCQRPYGIPRCAVCDALASLTAPVSSHSEEQS